jgi:hypothetical protein
MRETDDGQGVPFVFQIAMGVRPEDSLLLRQVDSVLARHRAEVRRILGEYGVPLVAAAAEEAT